VLFRHQVLEDRILHKYSSKLLEQNRRLKVFSLSVALKQIQPQYPLLLLMKKQELRRKGW
jgi:hypothetical protein